MKRKTPLQLQTLEDFYSEEKYPTQKRMEGYAAALGLTYKQVRGWFVEKRRRDKKDNGTIVPSHLNKNFQVPGESSRVGPAVAKRTLKRRDPPLRHRSKTNTSLSSRYKYASSLIENRTDKSRKTLIPLQDLLTPDYILKKVFRKDGPPLGVEFDSLPSRGFCQDIDSGNSQPACQETQGGKKGSSVAVQNCQDCNEKSVAVKKHGIGKGLMTVWQAVNPNSRDIPPGIAFLNKHNASLSRASTRLVPKPPSRKKRPRQLASILKQKRLESKLREKKKASVKRRKVDINKDDNHKRPCKEKCELALDGVISKERLDQFAMLADDEELEMRELQAGPNPLTCSDHLAASGLHGCSLCKDFLAKFPPTSVKMKPPFGMQPWDSCPESVKKLFKVFHFLYTYSIRLDTCPFTLDEFAQAFHDKDSLLLGKIHVALLKLLLLDVEMELSGAVLPNLSVSCKFLALLHSVENQEFILHFWKKSLNPLTWTEILRQVLVAAGFGSKQGALRREALSKEINLMAKYGLRSGTLKGELFRLLSEQGNCGLKVSDLANCYQITELNLASTTEELEDLICSTLSSDITLFEKISSFAYRLRINSLAKEASDFQSDTEDSGTVDDDSNDDGTCSSSDDSESDSQHLSLSKLRNRGRHKRKNNMLTVYTEIDESIVGEAWLLGLMEGEYVDLSIEEKLNALVALIDLVSASSMIRMEDPAKAALECVPKIYQHGSGAKIKRSSSNHQNFPRPSWVHVGQMRGVKDAHASSESHPVDSSSVSKFCGGQNFPGSGRSSEEEVQFDVHPMQSVFLGSDRRYNRYWLFLGPCNAFDPGHKRVYFESSEDGRWGVIDTEEALRALLSVLDDRGAREARLIESLEKREAFLCQAMSCRLGNDGGVRHLTQSDSCELDMVREDSFSPVSDVDNNLSLTETVKDSSTTRGAIVLEVGKKGEELNRIRSRLQEFDAWIWDCFYSNLSAVKHSKRSYLDSLTRCASCHDLYWRDEKHCKICHTTFELDFDLEERYAVHAATCREKGHNTFPKYKVLSSQLQSLKAAVHAIESVMPEEALVGAWTKSAHRLWVKRLRRTSSLSELLQVIADFVGAINEDWLWQCNDHEGSNAVMEEIITCFPNMPQTSSAVALWLVKLDALIAPYMKNVHSERKETGPKDTGRHAAIV